MSPQYGAIDHIPSVQSRAMQFVMGVDKYTPDNARNDECGWQPPHVKQ